MVSFQRQHSFLFDTSIVVFSISRRWLIHVLWDVILEVSLLINTRLQEKSIPSAFPWKKMWNFFEKVSSPSHRPHSQRSKNMLISHVWRILVRLRVIFWQCVKIFKVNIYKIYKMLKMEFILKLKGKLRKNKGHLVNQKNLQLHFWFITVWIKISWS